MSIFLLLSYASVTNTSWTRGWTFWIQTKIIKLKKKKKKLGLIRLCHCSGVAVGMAVFPLAPAWGWLFYGFEWNSLTKHHVTIRMNCNNFSIDLAFLASFQFLKTFVVASRCLDNRYPERDFLFRADLIVISPISNLRRKNGVGVELFIRTQTKPTQMWLVNTAGRLLPSNSVVHCIWH